MAEALISVLAIIGGCVVAFVVAGMAYLVKEKFCEWRKKGCKIKCLCKHKYMYDWTLGCWTHSELGLKCGKCGKKKILLIDYDSFKDMY